MVGIYGQKTIKTERELRLPSHYLWQPDIENICNIWLKSVHCSQQRYIRETFGNPTVLNATAASNMLFKRQINKRGKAKNLSFSLFLIQRDYDENHFFILANAMQVANCFISFLFDIDGSKF